jgi:TPP-dependent pyruvate/acetoin dehydrogenase alpha subunit
VERVADRAKSYNMPGVCIDGNDPVAVYWAAKEAIERARAGSGPTLIEALTFRFNGHLIGDIGEYIPKAEYQAALAADPYPRFRQRLIDNRHCTAEEVEALEAEVKTEIDAAVQFAFDSPLTDPAEIKRDVYADVAA